MNRFNNRSNVAEKKASHIHAHCAHEQTRTKFKHLIKKIECNIGDRLRFVELVERQCFT